MNIYASVQRVSLRERLNLPSNKAKYLVFDWDRLSMWQFEAENLSFDPKPKVSSSSHQEAYGSTQFQPPNTTPSTHQFLFVPKEPRTNRFNTWAPVKKKKKKNQSSPNRRGTSKGKRWFTNCINIFCKPLVPSPPWATGRETSGWPWAGSVSPDAPVPGRAAAAALCPPLETLH